jgi:hypothetical protein
VRSARHRHDRLIGRGWVRGDQAVGRVEKSGGFSEAVVEPNDVFAFHHPRPANNSISRLRSSAVSDFRIASTNASRLAPLTAIRKLVQPVVQLKSAVDVSGALSALRTTPQFVRDAEVEGSNPFSPTSETSVFTEFFSFSACTRNCDFGLVIPSEIPFVWRLV